MSTPSHIPSDSAERRAGPSPFTVTSLPRRAVFFVIYLGRFFWELLIANFQIAKAVLFQPREKLTPEFVDYPVGGLTKLEIIVLSHSLTLTPGTTTVEVAEDFSHLVVHAFDGSDPEAVRRAIKKGLEEPILAFTR